LDDLARIRAELAGLHTKTWGPHPLAHEPGRDMAVSLASSAQLLQLAADTERMLLDPRPSYDFPSERQAHRMSGHEVAFWGTLAHTHDRLERAAWITPLRRRAATRVGGQAAEVLADLATSERRVAVRSEPVAIRLQWCRVLVSAAFFGMAALAAAASVLP
jgi:hypothetical protein